MDFSIVTLLFYCFSFLVLFAAVMVVSVKNPVHSVLFLIFTFFNAAGLFVLLGAEYIAMTLVIVYVGAVAVLFLFVVMMLNIDFATWREGYAKRLPLGIAIAIALLTQLFLIFYASNTVNPINNAKANIVNSKQTNTEMIGSVLYTEYSYIFILSGLVLLVAMIGAIILTLRHSDNVKKQDINKQVSRKRSDSIELLQVQSGKGVDL